MGVAEDCHMFRMVSATDTKSQRLLPWSTDVLFLSPMFSGIVPIPTSTQLFADNCKIFWTIILTYANGIFQTLADSRTQYKRTGH